MLAPSHARSVRLLNRGVLVFVALVCAWQLSAPLRAGAGAMPYLADDFYYYAKIAVSIAGGHGSTFDGAVATNGYHPLYMLLLLVPARIGGGIAPFLWTIFGVGVAAVVVTFVSTRRLMVATGCGEIAANALALAGLAVPLRMFYQGMEVTLTIPLAATLLWLFWRACSQERVSVALAGCLGLLAALMVLSRLDSALLVVLLFAGVMGQPGLRRKFSTASGFAVALAGGVPVLVYCAINRAKFDSWLPLSGAAKQMRFSHVPSGLALASTWQGNSRVLVLLSVVALVGSVVTYRRVALPWRALLLPCALFPFVHVALLSVLSDWQIWGWYHYSFVPALLVLLVLAGFAFSAWVPRMGARPVGMVAGALLLLMAAITVRNQWRPDAEMQQIAGVARQVREFAGTHPGMYAMGDRGGMVAWLLPQRMFQTEGLVEDRGWLTTLHSQGDLVAALRGRGVRYYIATVWQSPPATVQKMQAATPVGDGCLLAIEPFQAGPSAPHLTAELCQRPVAEFDSQATARISAKRTLVFDLQPADTQSTRAQFNQEGR